jgi:hypothetical protein
MRRLQGPATVSSALGAALFLATALPGHAQGPAPAAPETGQPQAPGATAQPPAGPPDVAFTATLRIAELRFNEPPQAAIRVVVQPGGQPVVNLQLENVPSAPQAGTTYRDVGVTLTATGALADIAAGAANPGAAPSAVPPPAP